MAEKETYLLLAPEFGGTEFGPFTGIEIRLGSDPDANDITLPETLGVLPQHLKVITQGGNDFLAAPAERTAAVWLFRSGQQPKQATSPAAVQAGSNLENADGFSLVSPEGPKFFIIQREAKFDQKKPKSSSLGGAAKRLNKNSLLAEIRRRGFAAVVTTGIGRTVYKGFTYFRSGTFLRPRNIITAVISMAGFVTAGGASIVACNMAVARNATKKDLDSCESVVQACNGQDKNSKHPSIDKTSANILGNPNWERSLAADTEFRELYLKHIKNIIGNRAIASKYKWTYSTSKNSFARTLAQVGPRLPKPLGRILPYAAAYEGPARPQMALWSFVPADGRAEESCGRGPLGITWRMGQQLGLSPLQYDHAIQAADWAATTEVKREWMVTRAKTIRNTEPPDVSGLEIDVAPAGAQGGMMCAYAVGDDLRTPDNLAGLGKALGSRLGDGARQLPSIKDSYYVIARLVQFYAADYDGDLKELDFSEGTPPSVVLDKAPKTKDYALNQAALVAARATAIPCLAVLDKDIDEPPEFLGELPNRLNCIYLAAGVQYGLYQ